ncbi:MAG: hypothetical protein HQL80_06885 [Magnetococcales bacterium]|nr:hypothetical protein [Magnetococcales bacterium]
MNAEIVDLDRRRANMIRLAELIAEKQAFVDQLQSVCNEMPGLQGKASPSVLDTHAPNPAKPGDHNDQGD